MDEQPDVIVVGAGPVGQSAALLLARWGVPSLVLDAREARDEIGSRAIVQQRDVIDVWDAVGVGRQIAAEGITWRTARTYYRDRELFAVDFVDQGRSPFPPFVNISQARTEALLDRRIAEESLVDLRWGHRVTAMAADPDGVSVRCATAAGQREFRARYVIVCGGARGDDLRTMLGLTFDGGSPGDPAKSAARRFQDALRKDGVSIGNSVTPGVVPRIAGWRGTSQLAKSPFICAARGPIEDPWGSTEPSYSSPLGVRRRTSSSSDLRASRVRPTWWCRRWRT